MGHVFLAGLPCLAPVEEEVLAQESLEVLGWIDIQGAPTYSREKRTKDGWRDTGRIVGRMTGRVSEWYVK